MKTDRTARESKRVAELTTEYRKKGYAVVTPHSAAELPLFLQETGYIPDLVVTSKTENLIIEVKTQDTTRVLGRLSEIPELVNRQPGWQFVLVLTNRRVPASTDRHLVAARVNEFLEKASAMGAGDKAHVEAAFLFTWAALEASLHGLSDAITKSGKEPTTPWTLIRNAAMSGCLDRKDTQRLERLFRIRNSLVHAGIGESPTLGDVEFLRRIALENVDSTERKSRTPFSGE